MSLSVTLRLRQMGRVACQAWVLVGLFFCLMGFTASWAANTFVGINDLKIQPSQQHLLVSFATDLPLSYSLTVPNPHTVVLQLQNARFQEGLLSGGQLPVAQLPKGVTRVSWVAPKKPGESGKLVLMGPQLAQRRLLVQGAAPADLTAMDSGAVSSAPAAMPTTYQAESADLNPATQKTSIDEVLADIRSDNVRETEAIAAPAVASFPAEEIISTLRPLLPPAPSLALLLADSHSPEALRSELKATSSRRLTKPTQKWDSPSLETINRSFDSGDLVSSQHQLVALLKLHPKEASVWALLGELYLAAQQPVDATQSFEEALSLASDSQMPVYLDRWAVSLYTWSSPEKALARWRSQPALVDVILNQQYLGATVGASLASASGDIDVAIQYWERAVRLEPTAMEAHTQLGLLLELQQRSKEALAHYQTAVSLGATDDVTRQGVERLEGNSVLERKDPVVLAATEEPTKPEILKKKNVGSSKRFREPSVAGVALRFQRPQAFEVDGFRPY